MRKIFSLLVGFTFTFFCAMTPANADDSSVAKEYQVKVAFLYNFIKFVEWPGAKALGQTHTANICITGTDPFGPALDILTKASSAELAINIKRNVAADAVPSCHILFISRSEEGYTGAIIANASRYPVLTVSEIPGFADNGGIIEMSKTEKSIGLFSKDKINLRVNVKNAEAKQLRIDAQLLEIAAEVIRH